MPCDLENTNTTSTAEHRATLLKGIYRIYDGVEAETRKSQASFLII